MRISHQTTERMKGKILASKKYRNSGLNPETITDLIHKEAPHYSSEKDLLKAVRRKLHNIVAPYLGEPDYSAYIERFDNIQDYSLDSPELREFCLDLLREHASTAERIPFMNVFYSELFNGTGYPTTLLDLACGLHPLAFPWMGLPLTTLYYVYDIIQPRIDFINTFFERIGLLPLAENRDILVNPPIIPADVGLFLKEAHRFEKREPGCNQKFWQSLQVNSLVVSLPSQDLARSHSLSEYHQRLVIQNLPENRSFREILFPNEMVFIIENSEWDDHDN